MSIHPISNPNVQSTQSSTSTKTPSKADHPPTSSPMQKVDTVEISKQGLQSLKNASQSAAQEATETSAQTAQEAAKGDIQAQRKIAHQASAKS